MKAARHWQFALAACTAAAVLYSAPASAQAQAAPAKGQAPAAAKQGARPKVTHLLHLSAVKIESSGWTDQGVLDLVRAAGRILGQCGVKLERVELVNLVVPPSYLDLATPVSWALAREYRVAQPAVYFVRTTTLSPTFESEAIGREDASRRPELANTVWITSTASEPTARLAHDLAHVLMNAREHSDAPGNLMRPDISAQNTSLTPAQCARLRDNATSAGLLKKAK